IELGRRANSGESRADRGLGFEKSSPDSVGCRVAHAAIERSEGLAFVVGLSGLAEKHPELLGTEEQTLDLIGAPNAEGSSTAAVSISIATEDTLGTDGRGKGVRYRKRVTHAMHLSEAA